jgi:hypothetical protein
MMMRKLASITKIGGQGRQRACSQSRQSAASPVGQQQYVETVELFASVEDWHASVFKGTSCTNWEGVLDNTGPWQLWWCAACCCFDSGRDAPAVLVVLVRVVDGESSLSLRQGM